MSPSGCGGRKSDCAWIDELAAFRYPAALDNLLFGLRLGDDPRLCVTTTPKPVRLVTDLVDDPTTAIARGTTYENRAHLAPSFFERIVTKYEGTRLGQQELLAELLEVSDGAWFKSFDAAQHMTESAEYDPALPVHLAIDCGVSRHVAAVWFQVRRGRVPIERTPSGWIKQVDPNEPETVTVFGDHHAEGLYSEAAARAILARGQELPCRGRLDSVRLDPASSARTGIGPTAYAEFERVFGPRDLGRWPSHRVLDGLDQLEVLLDRQCLLIHPRCVPLKAAFQNYARKRTTGGDWLGRPGRPAAPARGPDGRAAGRGQGPVSRRPDRATWFPEDPRIASPGRSGREGVRPVRPLATHCWFKLLYFAKTSTNPGNEPRNASDEGSDRKHLPGTDF